MKMELEAKTSSSATTTVIIETTIWRNSEDEYLSKQITTTDATVTKSIQKKMKKRITGIEVTLEEIDKCVKENVNYKISIWHKAYRKSGTVWKDQTQDK